MGPDGGREHARNTKMRRGLRHGDFLDFGAVAFARVRPRERGATVADCEVLGARETHTLPPSLQCQKTTEMSSENKLRWLTELLTILTYPGARFLGCQGSCPECVSATATNSALSRSRSDGLRSRPIGFARDEYRRKL
jgi:hypothetical protein